MRDFFFAYKRHDHYEVHFIDERCGDKTVCHVNEKNQQWFNLAELEAYLEANPDKLREPEVVSALEIKRASALSALDPELWTTARFKKTTFPWQGCTIQADKGAQENLMGYAVRVSNGATGPFLWRDFDNTNHMLTPAEIIDLSEAMQLTVTGVWIKLFTARDKVHAATTVEQIDAALAEAEA